MTLQMPEENVRLRLKIARNLAVVQFKQGDYKAALNWFEMIMAAQPNIRDGFSIMLCHRCLGHEPLQLNDDFSNLVHVELDEVIFLCYPPDPNSRSALLVYYLLKT